MRIKVSVSVRALRAAVRGVWKPLKIVKLNVCVVVRQAHARREGTFVISSIEVPIVWRLAYEGRIIRAIRSAGWTELIRRIRTERETDLRSGVTVVGGHSQAAQGARQKLEVLLPGELDASDVSRIKIRLLAESERGELRVVGWEKSLGLNDWIGQTLVKPTGFDNADRLQVVLEEQIEIVGVGRFQVGIALGNPRTEREGLVDKTGWREVREVGTRNASSVDRPNVCAAVYVVLDLRAG